MEKTTQTKPNENQTTTFTATEDNLTLCKHLPRALRTEHKDSGDKHLASPMGFLDAKQRNEATTRRTTLTLLSSVRSGATWSTQSTKSDICHCCLPEKPPVARWPDQHVIGPGRIVRKNPRPPTMLKSRGLEGCGTVPASARCEGHVMWAMSQILGLEASGHCRE